MVFLGVQELRRRYLEKLYELSGADPRENVYIKQLEDVLGFSREEAKSAAAYLLNKDLISYKCQVLCVRITAKRIDEVEEAMQKSYAEKMRLVLQKIYEVSGPNHTNYVNYFELQRELGMNGQELNPILEYFEDSLGWLGGGIDEAVRLTPKGILEIENPRVEPSSGHIYQTNIYGSNYGPIQQGGQGNTQRANIEIGSSDDTNKE